MAAAIALYPREDVGVPLLYIADTCNQCVAKVKEYFTDTCEVQYSVEPDVLALFNKVCTFQELSDWIDRNYCYYSVVMEQQ